MSDTFIVGLDNNDDKKEKREIMYIDTNKRKGRRKEVLLFLCPTATQGRFYFEFITSRNEEVFDISFPEIIKLLLSVWYEKNFINSWC